MNDTNTTHNHAALVAHEMRGMGFRVAVRSNGYVRVWLKNRRVSAVEVQTALEQSELSELPIIRQYDYCLIDCRS